MPDYEAYMAALNKQKKKLNWGLVILVWTIVLCGINAILSFAKLWIVYFHTCHG